MHHLRWHAGGHTRLLHSWVIGAGASPSTAYRKHQRRGPDHRCCSDGAAHTTIHVTRGDAVLHHGAVWSHNGPGDTRRGGARVQWYKSRMNGRYYTQVFGDGNKTARGTRKIARRATPRNSHRRPPLVHPDHRLLRTGHYELSILREQAPEGQPPPSGGA